MTKILVPIHGVLLLDKPLGLSSNQALQKAKRLLRAQKAGHTGSLDPLATGLLPICFGEASKFAAFGLNANKAYEATMKLGVVTTTADSEGEVIAKHVVPPITPQALHQLTQRFLGDHEQMPPMYSALKQNGVPLYQLARAGKTVERKTRLVSIYDLVLTPIDREHVRFKVSCSKGTYVRTLAEDMAKALGCGGAHLTALRRVQIGDLSSPLVTLTALENWIGENKNVADLLLPVDIFLKNLPALSMNREASQALLQGKKVFCPHTAEGLATQRAEDELFRLYSEDKVFLGVGTLDALHYLQPKRLVSSEHLLYQTRTEI